MRYTSFALAVLAALSLPTFAAGSGQADEGPALDANVVIGVQAQLGVLPVDGKMGPRTQAAIEEFQRTKGLEPSGRLDAKTRAALGLGGPKPSSAAGASMPGKPSTPIGPSQSSAERAAEPNITHDAPTGEAK